MEKWWHKSVIYQIYPKSFADSNGDGVGDLQGIISKLDYLSYLGVEILWLSPLHPLTQSSGSYAVKDYYTIDTLLGTLDDFRQLVEKAHSYGMKIMIDLIFSHTSDEHPWFKEAKLSESNAKHNWYVWSDSGINCNLSPCWSFNRATGRYYLHTAGADSPDLNWHNSFLRHELYNVIQFWADLGVMAFCFGDVEGIGKNIEGNLIDLSTPENHQYLHELHKVCFLKKDILMVGKIKEASLADALVYTCPDQQELDIIIPSNHMSLDMLADNKWQMKKLDLNDLKTVMSCWQNLGGKGWNGLFFNNADQPRVVSRWGNDNIYQQESAKMLALCLHGLSGTPFVYQGEELGMTNYPFSTIEDLADPQACSYYNVNLHQGKNSSAIMQNIRNKTCDNARTPMQWDAGHNAGFSNKANRLAVNSNYKTINALQQREDDQSIWSFYQRLIRLRKTEPLLTVGLYELISKDRRYIYAYTRSSAEHKLLIICNFYDMERPYSLPEKLIFQQAELLLNNYPTEPPSLRQFMLKPYQALLYKLSL